MPNHLLGTGGSMARLGDFFLHRLLENPQLFEAIYPDASNDWIDIS
jgi:hypothetical protein